MSVLLSMKKEGANMSSGMGDGWGKVLYSLEPIQILLKTAVVNKVGSS